MEKLSKRALGCMYVSMLITALVELAALIAVNMIWIIPLDIKVGKIVSAVLLVLILLQAVLLPYFRFNRYRYKIDEEFIDVREGYIFVKRDIVPLERLHKMQTIRGPIDRIFNVAKVEVTTAGGDVTLRFLDEEKADIIAESLGKRINQIVVKQREENGEEHQIS